MWKFEQRRLIYNLIVVHPKPIFHENFLQEKFNFRVSILEYRFYGLFLKQESIPILF